MRATRARLVALAPWVLCWTSLTLLALGVGLSIANPDVSDEGALPTIVGALGFVLVPLVGALIATRLPDNAYGWLWCAAGLLSGLVAAAFGLWTASAVPGWLASLVLGASYTGLLCLVIFLLLLFPTGRLPARSWRWVAMAGVLVTCADLLLVGLSPSLFEPAEPAPWAMGGRAGAFLTDALEMGVKLLFLLVLPAAASVLVRFRRAGPVERQQLKWFLLAAALAVVTIALEVLEVSVDTTAWAVIDAATFALLPAAVGIAVLRYRLYEIDRLISRTVSYGVLTGGVVLLFLGLVAVLRPLLDPVTGGSNLAVAGSTLAVAAVFDPARRRLQAAVDRRFDRARYDASKAVDAFAARLRDQVDLDEVTAGLRETVATTVAPTRVAVWLRAAPPGRKA